MRVPFQSTFLRRAVAAVTTLFILSGSSTAFAADEPLVLRIIVHRPGVVRMDGHDFLDLTRRSGRAPEPWRKFTMHLASVEPGHHELSLRPEDPLSISTSEVVNVEGGAGDTVGVVLGRPRVTTSPAGARVFVNGNPLGNTPLSINPADLTKTSVRLELDGYQTMTLTGDSILTVAKEGGSYRLELVPVDSDQAPLPPLTEPRSYWDRNRKLALGATVALLGAGIYAGLRFKDQADERYTDYLHTGNLDRQKELLSDAERLDRLSLLGWGVGELAFLATFFLIIHEEPRGLVPTATVESGRIDGETRVKLGFSHDF